MNWFKLAQYSHYDIEDNPPTNIDPSQIRFVTEKGDYGGFTRKVLLGDDVVGEVEVNKDIGFERSSKRLFSDFIKPNDLVFRFYGIYLAKPLRNKGIGKKMFIDAFQYLPDVWLGNSELGYGGTDFAAIHALESLVPQIELHWFGQKGGNWVARLTKQAQGGIEPQKYYSSGFYLMSDYLKVGGAYMKEFTTENAINKLINEKKFFPTYMSVEGELVLDIKQPLLNDLHELGRKAVEQRDSSLIEKLTNAIKSQIIK